jgi:hypothetical protein
MCLIVARLIGVVGAVGHDVGPGRMLGEPVHLGPLPCGIRCERGRIDVGTRESSRVPDHLLWTLAAKLPSGHTPDPAGTGHCGLRACGQRYPCLDRRLADQAACRRGWSHTWTVRHDLLSCHQSGAVSAARLLTAPATALPGGDIR